MGFTWQGVQLHHFTDIRFLGKSFPFLSLRLLVCEMGIISPPTWLTLREDEVR